MVLFIFVLTIIGCDSEKKSDKIEVFANNYVGLSSEDDDIAISIVSNQKIEGFEIINPGIINDYIIDGIELENLEVSNKKEKLFYNSFVVDIKKLQPQLSDENIVVTALVNGNEKEINLGSFSIDNREAKDINDYFEVTGSILLKYSDSIKNEEVNSGYKAIKNNMEVIDSGFSVNNENISCKQSNNKIKKVYKKNDEMESVIKCENKLENVATITGRPYFIVEYSGEKFVVYGDLSTRIFAEDIDEEE